MRSFANSIWFLLVATFSSLVKTLLLSFWQFGRISRVSYLWLKDYFSISHFLECKITGKLSLPVPLMTGQFDMLSGVHSTPYDTFWLSDDTRKRLPVFSLNRREPIMTSFICYTSAGQFNGWFWTFDVFQQMITYLRPFCFSEGWLKCRKVKLSIQRLRYQAKKACQSPPLLK